jgi:hypothetical protein
MNTTAAEPHLAPPGAGIPAIERLIGGAFFALQRWRGTRERFAAQFARERQAIAKLYEPCDEPTLRRRVLIPRLRGLEDSSRYWSVCMTLDHLRIVNGQIARVIGELKQGRVPEGSASTAAVKPNADARIDGIAEYESSCDRINAVASAELRTKARYAHPWFGPLDAAGWHAMAAVHMGIHRAQIARILAEAPTKTR